MKKILGLLLLIATMTTTLTATASVDYARTEIVYSTSLPIEIITTVETLSESFLVSEIEASTLCLGVNNTSIEYGDVGWSKEALYTKYLDSTDSTKEVGWSFNYFAYKVRHPFNNSRETIRTENLNSDKEDTRHYRATENKKVNILATHKINYLFFNNIKNMAANILAIKIMPTLNNAVIRTLSLVGI